MALLVEGLSPGGENTSLEEYIVAPITDITGTLESGRDCIKLYGPNEEEVSMVAQPITGGGSMMMPIPSRQGSMGISKFESQASFKDPIVTLFDSLHDNLSVSDTVRDSFLGIHKVTSVSSNMGDTETNNNTVSDNLHTPLLSRQTSSTIDRSNNKANNTTTNNNSGDQAQRSTNTTNIGGGWQLVYKAIGGSNRESGLQRVYLHPDAAGGSNNNSGGGMILLSQRATSFNVSNSGLELNLEADQLFPAAALVSQSVLGTNKDMEKILSEVIAEEVVAKASGWRALLEPGVKRALIVGIGLQVLQQV